MTDYNTKVKVEDGKLYAHTVFQDDATLERNKLIRNENLLEKSKLGIHEEEDLRFVISCPTVFQWNLFKRDFGDVYSALMSSVEGERMSGATRLQLLHPEWIVFERL